MQPMPPCAALTSLAHALQALMDKLDRDLEYAISVECKTPLEDVADYKQVSSSFWHLMLASAERWASCFLHARPGMDSGDL